MMQETKVLPLLKGQVQYMCQWNKWVPKLVPHLLVQTRDCTCSDTGAFGIGKSVSNNTVKINLLPRNITKIIQILTACAPAPGFNILTFPPVLEEKMCPHLPALLCVAVSTYPLTSAAVSEVNNFIPHPPCISLRFFNKHFLYVRVYLASFSILT